MDIPQEIDGYLRESIEFSLGLLVSTRTLELKIQSSEETQRHLQDQFYHLKSKLMEKDKTIERVRAESSMNAQAVKKFVEENKKLAMECSNLLDQYEKLENECSLYDRDVNVLMDFGNEADERAKLAESRVLYLEEELCKLSEKLQVFKQQSEGKKVGSLFGNEYIQHLVDALLSALISKDDVASMAHSFLETNYGIDVCEQMLNVWDSLKPSTRHVLALAYEVKKLQNEKEYMRINLMKAEDEVTVLFDENNVLNEENKKLRMLLKNERQVSDSDGNQSSASIKSYKRKSSPCPKENFSTEKKINFGDAVDSTKQTLYTTLHNK